jgi:hypothetical protein
MPELEAAASSQDGFLATAFCFRIFSACLLVLNKFLLGFQCSIEVVIFDEVWEDQAHASQCA